MNILVLKVYKDIEYRDGIFALLAVMYSKIDGERTKLQERIIKESVCIFTDSLVDEDDQITRTPSVWKQMNNILIKNKYVEKSLSAPHVYWLTQIGYQLCYHVFSDPEKTPPEVIIQPPWPYFVTSQGYIRTSSSDDLNEQNATMVRKSCDKIAEKETIFVQKNKVIDLVDEVDNAGRRSDYSAAYGDSYLFNPSCRHYKQSIEHKAEGIGGGLTFNSEYCASRPMPPVLLIDLTESDSPEAKMIKSTAVESHITETDGFLLLQECSVAGQVKVPTSFRVTNYSQDVQHSNVHDIDIHHPPSQIASPETLKGVSEPTIVPVYERLGELSLLWDDELIRVDHNSTIVLLMDTRERMRNNFYRQFYLNVIDRFRDDAPYAGVMEAELQAGDFVFALQNSIGRYDGGIGGDFDGDGDMDEQSIISDVAIERKTINDIVERSAGGGKEHRGGTGAHFTQERRLRHSGLLHSFMLIEGETCGVDRLPGALRRKEGDFENPDVIDSSGDLINYMAGVIARNYSSRRVRILQTGNSGHTLVLLAAMAEVLHSSQHCDRPSNKPLLRGGPSKKTFDRHCRGWGGAKRGRELDFRNSLHDERVGVEVAERLSRRFGAWEPVVSALYECYSTGEDEVVAETRCELLFCGLDVGGTNLQKSMLSSASPQSLCWAQNSACVWHQARSHNDDHQWQPLLPPRAERDRDRKGPADVLEFDPSFKYTTVVLSSGVDAYIPVTTALPSHFRVRWDARDEIARSSVIAGDFKFGGDIKKSCSSSSSSSYIGGSSDGGVDVKDDARIGKSTMGKRKRAEPSKTNEEPVCVWMQLQSCDEISGGITRHSADLLVIVLPGEAIVEALIDAVEIVQVEMGSDVGVGMGRDGGRDCAIARMAFDSLQGTISPLLSTQHQHADVSVRSVRQVVLVLEDFFFVNSNHGAMGKLHKESAAAQHAQQHYMSLRKGGRQLSTAAARWVASRSVRLAHMLIAVISLDQGWQCFQCKRKETQHVMMALLHEWHRQSLLLY